MSTEPVPAPDSPVCRTNRPYFPKNRPRNFGNCSLHPPIGGLMPFPHPEMTGGSTITAKDRLGAGLEAGNRKLLKEGLL